MTNLEVDKKKQTATARVEYTWSLKTRGIVEKTTTKQKWERRDSEWVVAGEERVKGAPLVLFDEPAPPTSRHDRARVRRSTGSASSAYNYAGLNLANDSLDFVQRGKVSIVRRQYAEAVKICRLGLLGQPSLLEGRLVLGMALTALGRWDEVLAEMRVALETDPNAALAWLLKGEALVGKGDYQQAEQTLKRAKELDPSNSKADQLLAEIATARAAGFDGLPAEPTDTKVYPARVTANTDPRARQRRAADADGSRPAGAWCPTPTDVSVEYEDDATEVDPDPSDRSSRTRTGRPDKPASVLVDFGESEDTVEDSQVGTETFHKPGGGRVDDSSYEGPATDDYGERARPRVSSQSVPTLAAKKPPTVGGGFDSDEPSRRFDDDAGGDPARQAADGGAASRRRSAVRRHGGFGAVDRARLGRPHDGAVARTASRAASRRPSTARTSEDEQTRQRRQRQVDEHAGTVPETPEPVLQRQRPVRPSFDAARRAGRSRRSREFVGGADRDARR